MTDRMISEGRLMKAEVDARADPASYSVRAGPVFTELMLMGGKEMDPKGFHEIGDARSIPYRGWRQGI